MNIAGTTERARALVDDDVVGRHSRQRPAAIAVTGLRTSYGAVEVLHAVDLTVPTGAVVALLGPSGCGKTTLLRSIAGLERSDAGEVRLGDRLVSGPSVHVPPEKRRIGMVFQDWALFPHLTVAQNVGYGLPRAERKGPRVDDVLAMVGLAGLGDRLPATLSGGQQQRVALARALAPRPKVLLLDEPFSNLDASLRTRVRREVHQLLAELGVTTVFVTHDQEEAFVLGDEVAVMQAGQVVQQATPADLYARPVAAWVAGFVGDANFVAGDARDGRATTALGDVPVIDDADGAVQVLLRPEELRLSLPGNGGIPAKVVLQEYYGHDTVYLVRLATGEELRVRAGSVPRFQRGDAVSVSYGGPPAVVFADDEPAPETGSELPVSGAGSEGGGGDR